jgi:hypothetical protein
MRVSRNGSGFLSGILLFGASIADYVEDHDVGVAVAGSDVDVGGPTGRAKNVSGFLEVLLADASWAPHVHPLAVEPRAGEQDDGKPAVPRLDPGLGAACSDPVRAQAASHRNVARLYQSGIGPFGEDAAVAMTVAEMQAANASIHAIAGKRRYPDSSHICDLALGALPDWAIEVKLARLARQKSFANSWPIAGEYVMFRAKRLGLGRRSQVVTGGLGRARIGGHAQRGDCSCVSAG